MEKRRVRISDIAQELGLSTATVSNVLHGKTDKVSDRTVQRVQAALEERQYIPSMAGILLAQNASRIIGVIVNDHEKYESHALEDVYISSALDSLSTRIEASGRFMMLKKATRSDEIIRFASMWNLDGLVLTGFCAQDYQALRRHMRLPFVVYDGFFRGGPPEGVCNITVDNLDGGRQVGELFRRLGHRRAVCVSDNNVLLDRARMEGFRAGFGDGEVLFLQVPMQKAERLAFYEAHLAGLRAHTAVFAVSDFYAIELMGFLERRGLSVPKDISVAGFDDAPICALVTPSLSSVRQDVDLRSAMAMEKLDALREGRETGSTLTLPVRLVERESTGPAPG